MNIVNCIPRGEQNAISRTGLRDKTGKPDRLNRNDIRNARLCGYQIISSSGGKGYWMATSDGEWMRFEREQVHRAQAILEQFGGKYRIVEVQAGPGEVFVRAHTRHKRRRAQLDGQTGLNV